MAFLQLVKTMGLKINLIRHIITNNIPKNTTNIARTSQLLKKRLIGSASGNGGSLAVLSTMLKREDYIWNNNDHIFSNLKILVGSKDWEEYKKGIDGVSRYRLHNLPYQSSPGLYELGVGLIGQDQGRRKLDPNDEVLASYLGQGGDVRSRLQSYGRTGGHLSPLFRDIFSKQGSILYRWTPMRTKKEAEDLEGMVLSFFDYPWNQLSNGKRREFELLQKLQDHEFMSKRDSGELLQLYFHCFQNEVALSTKDEKEEEEKEEVASGRCEAITKKGLRCKRSSSKGSKFCWQHR